MDKNCIPYSMQVCLSTYTIDTYLSCVHNIPCAHQTKPMFVTMSQSG